MDDNQKFDDNVARAKAMAEIQARHGPMQWAAAMIEKIAQLKAFQRVTQQDIAFRHQDYRKLRRRGWKHRRSAGIYH